MNIDSTRSGFTLMELLLAVTIIIVLFVGIVAFLDPAGRLSQARNLTRTQDIEAIATALALYKQDNPGAFYETGTGLTDAFQMITNGNPSDCPRSTVCSAERSATGSCISFLPLLSNYIKEIPKDPLVGNENGLTYYYAAYQDRQFVVGACEPEAENEDMPLPSLVVIR